LHFHNIPHLNISEHFICYKKLSLKHSCEESSSSPTSVDEEGKAPNPAGLVPQKAQQASVDLR